VRGTPVRAADICIFVGISLGSGVAPLGTTLLACGVAHRGRTFGGSGVAHLGPDPLKALASEVLMPAKLRRS